MQSKPQNPPNKHHFIPEFLLKQWAGPEGEFWRFFRQGPDRIDCKPAAPGAVCYRRGLYATGHIPAEHKQQVETLFMAPLDTKAAEAHALLLEGAIARLSDEQRCRWAGFMMSIWFRTPHDVAGMRDIATALFDAGAVTRALGLDEEVEFPPGTADQFAMDLMMNSIDDKGRGEELINMHWNVIAVRNRREFFISDWPMDKPVSVPRLGAGSSYVAMPIAPDRLFVASHSRTLITALRDMPERELITRQNRATVRQADEFVGATNRHAERFIRDNFGTLDRPSLIAGIAAKYRAMAAPS